MPPRRSFLVSVALVATIVSVWFAPASARDLKINMDPSGAGFTIEGWAMQTSNTGTIFHQCQQDICGRGSTVSLRKQASGTFTVATLRQNEQRISALLSERLQGKIARIDITPVRDRSDKVFRMAELTRTIVPAPGAEIGMQQYWKSGFASTSTGGYSLASSASSRKLADANFATFQLPILLMLKLQSGRSAGE
ncbi:hypothetical protein [Bosea sp. 685]|uniref:hypothetical protein n=1 Tax=Bosea sp. 685 TaxID=3080057 RepID=UPI0028930F62|nr:hypothetical protein [Bosea sp. 685]WNJ88125.1 hypothetical protein RMR04_17040 [Bosea sp. 685]